MREYRCADDVESRERIGPRSAPDYRRSTAGAEGNRGGGRGGTSDGGTGGKERSIITDKLFAVSRPPWSRTCRLRGRWTSGGGGGGSTRDISHQCQFQGFESVRSTVTLKRVDIYRPTRPNVLPGLCDAHHSRVIHVSGMAGAAPRAHRGFAFICINSRRCTRVLGN